MKSAELKDLTPDDLTRRAGEIRENLFNLKIRRRAGTLESVSDVTKNKRDLARILTLLTQKTNSSKAAQRTAPKATPNAQPPTPNQPAEKKEAP